MSDFELNRLLPEIIISLMACTILVIAETRLKKFKNLPFILTLATLAIAGLIASVGIFRMPDIVLEGMFIGDPFAYLNKVMICLLVFVVFIYSREYSNPRKLARSEYYVLGLFSVVGMMILASANHLLSIYLGLELMSLCLYAMVAFQRDSGTATEAAMKYFVLGAIGSGSLLYGLSIIYGLTGSLDIAVIETVMSEVSIDNLPLILALVFVITGLAFKLGAAPFHMWVPDVYHGAPTATTIFLSTAPKIAAFAMLLRLLIGGLESLLPIWQDMLIVIAILSITIGNVIAIAQENLKRMLAYSAIAHTGFMLLGVLSGTEDGYSASLFYILIYSVMTLGAFGIIVLSAKKDSEAELISDYHGLNRKDPWMAFLLLLIMFSLAGIPPTAGFYAKLVVIQALIDANLVWVAVVAVLLAVVGAFYYLRVIKVAFFDDLVDDNPVLIHTIPRTILGINAIALIAIIPWVGDAIAICRATIFSLI